MSDTHLARKFSSTKVLAVFLSVSSVAAIVLALLGYGVALSADARFGIPHAVIFNSTSDLLTLGGWAVMQMLYHLDKLSEWSFYTTLLGRSWPATRNALTITTVGLVLAGVAFGIRYIAPRWRWLNRRAAQVGTFVSTHGRLAKLAGLPLIIVATLFLALPLASLALLFGLALLGCFLSIVPIVGLQAGIGHIDDWVVGPSICAPLRSREVRLQAGPPQSKDAKEKIRSATCVTVKKTGGHEYQGRVVFATFNAVVLYDPADGSVRRVSTEGASIEVIDKL